MARLTICYGRTVALAERFGPAVRMAADGEISKLDSKHFYDQVIVTVKCLLAMQEATADQLKGATSF